MRLLAVNVLVVLWCTGLAQPQCLGANHEVHKSADDHAPAAAGQASLRGAILDALRSGDQNVRLAALRALEKVGTADDVPTLAQLATTAGSDAERRAAFQTLSTLSAEGTDEAIRTCLGRAPPNISVTLIRGLVARHATSAVPGLLTAAKHASPQVRAEAFQALQALADGDAAAALVKLLAQTPRGREREAAERAVSAACRKIPDPQRQADPLLAALDGADVTARCALLPALGRLGGDRALELIHAAMKDPSPQVQDAGVRALANWPDAGVAPGLLEIVQHGSKQSHRIWALRAYARVVAIPGRRPPPQTFNMLRQAMSLARRTEDKQLILSRLAAVRTPEALEMALSLTCDKALRGEATKTAAALAEALRTSHPAASRAAIHRLLPLTNDPALRARLNRLLEKMNR
jgi:HEAT repeat protein